VCDKGRGSDVVSFCSPDHVPMMRFLGPVVHPIEVCTLLFFFYRRAVVGYAMLVVRVVVGEMNEFGGLIVVVVVFEVCNNISARRERSR